MLSYHPYKAVQTDLLDSLASAPLHDPMPPASRVGSPCSSTTNGSAAGGPVFRVVGLGITGQGFKV